MSEVIVPTKELLVGQFERTEDLNGRIYSRNVPDTHLENWFSPAAQSTRFIKMPVVCGRGRASASAAAPQVVPVVHAPYNTTRDFAAVTRTAPFRGFTTKIDTESSLRNQFYAIQTSDQSVYIPSSTSDLYRVNTAVGRIEEQTHPGLFERYELKTGERPNVSNIGMDRWFNHTRTQLRGGSPAQT